MKAGKSNKKLFYGDISKLTTIKKLSFIRMRLGIDPAIVAEYVGVATRRFIELENDDPIKLEIRFSSVIELYSIFIDRYIRYKSELLELID